MNTTTNPNPAALTAEAAELASILDIDLAEARAIVFSTHVDAQEMASWSAPKRARRDYATIAGVFSSIETLSI